MIKNRAVIGALGIWAASSVPCAAAALSFRVCNTNGAGKQVCQSRIPRSARIALGVGCLAVLLLLCGLVFCVVRNRRAAAASEQEYNVEASQVDGPPTIIDTAYHPKSGPSGVYSAGGRTSPQMSGPAFPVAAQVHITDYSRTAPVSQVQFANQPYPFTPGVGPTAPKTAFVSGGFPRPLLAGNRLKDRLKERPASVSSNAPASR